MVAAVVIMLMAGKYRLMEVLVVVVMLMLVWFFAVRELVDANGSFSDKNK